MAEEGIGRPDWGGETLPVEPPELSASDEGDDVEAHSGEHTLPVEPPELMATEDGDPEVEAHSGEHTLPVEPPELS